MELPQTNVVVILQNFVKNNTNLATYEYECSKDESGYVNHRICREKPCQICCKLLLSMGVTNEPAILCQKRCFGSPKIDNVTETAKFELAGKVN